MRPFLSVLFSLALLLSARADVSAAGGSASLEPTADVRHLLRDAGALVRWVREHDAAFGAAVARTRQAEADVGNSRLVPNPIFDASLSDVVIGPTNPRGLQFGDTAIYTAGLSQMVELGKRGPRSRAAELRLSSSQMAASATLTSRVAEARLALGRVVYSNAKQAIFAEQLASSKEIAELQAVRMRQGALSGNDYDRLVLDTMSLELDVERNRVAGKAAMTTCRAALYAVCDAADASLADLDLDVRVPAGSVEMEQALMRRADLKALALERDAANQDAILASRRAIPDPQVRLGYTHDNLLISGDQGNTLSAGVLFPLPLFDRGQHDRDKAVARANELDRTAKTVLQMASAELEELLARREFVERSLESVERQAVPKSETIVSTTLKAFGQGQVSLTDLLVARRMHISLLLTVLDLKFDRFTVRSEIRRTLGTDALVASSRSEP